MESPRSTEPKHEPTAAQLLSNVEDPTPSSDAAAQAPTPPSSKAPRRLRRQYMVLRRFQTRLILHHFLVSSLFAVLVASALFGPLVARLLAGTSTESERSDDAMKLLMLHEVFWPVLALSPIILVGISLLISHRIAGPLYRFRHVYRNLIEGRIVRRFRLRPRDLLHDEADVLNEVLDSLRERVTAIQGRQRALSLTVDELTADTDGVAEKPLGRVRLELLRRQARELEEEVAAFQVERPVARDAHGVEL